MSMKVLMFAVTLQTAVYVTSLRIPQTDLHTKQAETVLRRHNIYRLCHNAPALQLDEHLSLRAQQCAAGFAFNRSQLEENGTNVFSHHSFTQIDSDEQEIMDLVGASAVDQWYREQLKYPESMPTNFSQLVWKSSKKLGVGIAQADDGEVFVCCMYDPVGNVHGLYEDNVLYSPRLSDTDIEKCLQSVNHDPAETAAIYKNIVRPPMFLLLVNETADGEEGNSTAGASDVTPGADPGSSTDSASLTPKADESNSTVNATARNCTGPNCTRTNDTRPLMNALKKELQLAVAENSNKTNDLIKIAIVIAIIIMLFVVIVLIVTVVILTKILKMMQEDECCETGNETPADEPRFAKSTGTSTSVPQSLQSYM